MCVSLWEVGVGGGGEECKERADQLGWMQLRSRPMTSAEGYWLCAAREVSRLRRNW
jgi:hypothetical protein